MRESLNGGKGTFIPASQPELKLCFPISLNPGSPRRQNLLSFIDFIFSASSPAGGETKRAVLRIEILQHKAAPCRKNSITRKWCGWRCLKSRVFAKGKSAQIEMIYKK